MPICTILHKNVNNFKIKKLTNKFFSYWFGRKELKSEKDKIKWNWHFRMFPFTLQTIVRPYISSKLGGPRLIAASSGLRCWNTLQLHVISKQWWQSTNNSLMIVGGLHALTMVVSASNLSCEIEKSYTNSFQQSESDQMNISYNN